MREITRRDFMKLGGLGMLGVFVVNGKMNMLPLPTIAPKGGSAKEVRLDDNPTEHSWRFVVDINKCIGCGKCLKACKLENDVPPEPDYNRSWVERYAVTGEEEMLVDSPNAGIDGFAADYMNVKYQDINIQKTFFVPKLCNQCDKPPCVSVCPVAATYMTPEGVILVDRKACIGCRYCIQACPYGARYLDPRFKVVDKCTWCYHRVTKGLLPACVEVCPVGARLFGDTQDPDSSVSKIIKEQSMAILKPEIGNKNKVYYAGLEKGVR